MTLSGVGGGMTPKGSLLMPQPVAKTEPLVSGIALDLTLLD